MILVLGWVLLSVRLPVPPRYGVRLFVFSSLPIRKVLVLPFAGGVSPSASGGFSFVFSELSTADRRSYYLFFNYLFFNYLYIYRFMRRFSVGIYRFMRSWLTGRLSVYAWKTGLDHRDLWINSPRDRRRKPQERLSAALASPLTPLHLQTLRRCQRRFLRS